MNLSDFSVLSFDCYGTLIDWETGICESLEVLATQAGLDEERILELHAKHESRVQQENPRKSYSDILAEVSRIIADEYGVKWSDNEAQSYGLSVSSWKPFPDTVEALKYLKNHFKLVILSNVDQVNFDNSEKLLEVEFDHVFLAEDIGSYKPDPANFLFMLSRLAESGLERSEILHTAESVFHDHIPANDLGLANCWIHRRKGKEGFGATAVPSRKHKFVFEFETLGEMVSAHRSEV